MTWNQQYPLGRLIAERANALGLAKNDVVRALGYRNLDKGRRRLEHLLVTGADEPGFTHALCAALELEAAVLEPALEATHQARQAEAEALERSRFRPHVFVETEGQALERPFFVRGGLWVEEKLLAVPEPPIPWDAQRLLRHVRRRVAWHYRRHGGQTPSFGRITGYVFHATYDHAIALNVDGTVREPYAERSEEARPILTVKGRPIPPRLFQ